MGVVLLLSKTARERRH